MRFEGIATGVGPQSLMDSAVQQAKAFFGDAEIELKLGTVNVRAPQSTPVEYECYFTASLITAPNPTRVQIPRQTPESA